MKILVIGGGGREHALVWKIAQSPLVDVIYCAPGNAGIAKQAQCVAIPADNVAALLQFAKTEKIDLTVVGPEAPLVKGIVNLFTDDGLKIVGPTRWSCQSWHCAVTRRRKFKSSSRMRCARRSSISFP